MAAETPSSESSSRKAFLRRGATAAAASWGLVAAVASPAPSLAKDIGGIDVKGIDVAEMLHPGAGGGSGKASRPLRDCLLSVERVRVSMQQLEDTLTNEEPPPGLAGLVKGLIKNYKLDESLQQGAMYIERPGDRNAAASAGMEALEYLAQTAEYFPVQIDDRTGKPKKMNAETLEFTINALSATRGKLEFFLSKVPTDALRDARAEIKAEGSDT